MRSKNSRLWLLTVLQMHLVDEEWDLPRRENDRNDLTRVSYCQNGRPHSARRHVQRTLLKIPEAKISPSDANFMLYSDVVTYCSRAVYMTCTFLRNVTLLSTKYPTPKRRR